MISRSFSRSWQNMAELRRSPLNTVAQTLCRLHDAVVDGAHSLMPDTVANVTLPFPSPKLALAGFGVLFFPNTPIQAVPDLSEARQSA